VYGRKEIYSWQAKKYRAGRQRNMQLAGKEIAKTSA